MEWFRIIYFVLLMIYVVFILLNIPSLFTVKKNSTIENTLRPDLVTIIIPARNEEKNILKCLQSLSLQEFPKEYLQVIVVNDHSTDDTGLLAKQYLQEHFPNSLLLELQNEEGKKSAILKAAEQASGSIIITRDADTFTNDPQWLNSILQHFQTTNCDLLISPVFLSSDNSFLQTFQQYENIAITSLGLSMAAKNIPFVCSGANLAYKKDVFLSEQPYKNNMHIASGDDMFLLKSFYKSKRQIKANLATSAIAFTPAEDSLKKMLIQRLRWASKTSSINTPPVFLIGVLVLLINMLCLAVFCLALFNTSYLWFGLLTFILKFIIDFLLLFLSARMFRQKINWLWFPVAFVFNGLYVPAVVLASSFIKPTWRPRRS